MSSSWLQILDQAGVSPVAAIAAVLATIAAMDLGLRRWMARRARRVDLNAAAAPPAEGRPGRWVTTGARELLPAVTLLLWLQGLYIALGLVLQSAVPSTSLAATLALLGTVYGLCVAGTIIWLLARVGRLLERALIAVAHRTDSSWDDVLLTHAGKAIRFALPLLAVILGAPALSLPQGLADVVRHATSLLLIGMVAFVLVQVVDGAAALVLRQHQLDVSDNLQARAVYTQVIVLKKVALTTIAIVTLASMLMVFETVRQFGASILASAGIAGIVVGFAAQRSIATLLAGFQIALTQPIRMDDVVIVENEWGRVEDITLTYVVVRVWDLRRLIVPITYFIEKPFQNWTRASADLLGSVRLHVDYTVPLPALRRELTRILESSDHWDGKVNVLQVTDAKERTLELRALASATDASLSWDLRCEIREKLVTFLQAHHPDSLPKVRASVETQSATVAPSAASAAVAPGGSSAPPSRSRDADFRAARR